MNKLPKNRTFKWFLVGAVIGFFEGKLYTFVITLPFLRLIERSFWGDILLIPIGLLHYPAFLFTFYIFGPLFNIKESTVPIVFSFSMAIQLGLFALLISYLEKMKESW